MFHSLIYQKDVYALRSLQRNVVRHWLYTQVLSLLSGSCCREKFSAVGYKLSGSAFKYSLPSSVQGLGQPIVLS